MNTKIKRLKSLFLLFLFKKTIYNKSKTCYNYTIRKGELINMDLLEIQNLCRKYAKEFWGLELDVPVLINSRMRSSLGFVKFQHHRPISIEFSKRLIDNYSDQTIDGVIRHELCHWALAKLGKPFKDGHPVWFGCDVGQFSLRV